MIIGTGVDMVEIKRIQPLVQKEKFIERILSPKEQNAYANINHPRRQVEFLAGRFVAKEAYAKAVGTGIGANLSWRDISVLNNKKGQPILSDKNEPSHQVHISITHTENFAAAFVIIEGLSG